MQPQKNRKTQGIQNKCIKIGILAVMNGMVVCSIPFGATPGGRLGYAGTQLYFGNIYQNNLFIQINRNRTFKDYPV